MAMKLAHLKTYWTTDDAHAIISLLDELRDVLWAAYGPDIVEQQRGQCTENQEEEFDDIIDF